MKIKLKSEIKDWNRKVNNLSFEDGVYSPSEVVDIADNIIQGLLKKIKEWEKASDIEE